MCNFNKQSEEVKSFLHLFMQKASKSIGGDNFLLSLIEAMKSKKPNPLMYRDKKISSNNTTIRWNKVVFDDKVKVLENILSVHRSSENPDFNILAQESAKMKKTVTNMVRTLSPIEFIVTPQNHNDGEGFSFKVFDKIEDDCVTLNPIFIAMFFCSIDFTKKTLKYKID